MNKLWTGALLALTVGCDPASVDAPWGDEALLEGGGGADGGGGNPDADTDGDGFTDGEEAEQGTDPNDAADVPYAGGWPKGACRDEIEGTGRSQGDTLEDFVLTDQYGEEVSAHDFCDRVLFVVAAAGW